MKAFLTRTGRRVRCLSLCTDFSAYVDRYHPGLKSLDREIGEFAYTWHELYFSSLLFVHRTPRDLIRATLDDQRHNRDIFRTHFAHPSRVPPTAWYRTRERQGRRIERYCRLMREFLDRRVRTYDWRAVDVVGFSCVEAQFLTSVFLARQLRARWPELRIVFGGPFFQSYNAEAILADFPEIDHLVLGEGESALHEILTCVEQGRPVPRLYSQPRVATGQDSLRPEPRAGDDMPPPDYEDLQLPSSGLSLTTYMGQGCSHWRCSFCANNERGQRLRTANTVFDEIRSLARNYDTRSINFGDPEINGDPLLLEAVCDRLIAAGIRLDAWGEINARNTSPRLLRKMEQAGIDQVQVGIESFSPAVLRRIRKPATLLDNVKVLKWSIEAGFRNVHFNILCDAPQSTHEDARVNWCVLRSISHLLRPPVSVVLNEVDLYRTSDMFERAPAYGVRDIADYEYYRRCFPGDHLRAPIPMFNLAYERAALDPLWHDIGRYLDALKRRPARLTMRKSCDGVLVVDSRRRKPVRHRFTGLDALVLRNASSCVTHVAEIASVLDAPPTAVVDSLSRLRRASLVMEDRGRYLALPLCFEALETPERGCRPAMSDTSRAAPALSEASGP